MTEPDDDDELWEPFIPPGMVDTGQGFAVCGPITIRGTWEDAMTEPDDRDESADDEPETHPCYFCGDPCTCGPKQIDGEDCVGCHREDCQAERPTE